MSGELLVIQNEGVAGTNPKKVRLKIMSASWQNCRKIANYFSRIINAPSGSFFLLGPRGNSLSKVVTRGG